jgi:hypothetical protein
MRYFTSNGPKKGAIMWRHNYEAIGVLAHPFDDLDGFALPIGMALGNRWDDDGRQLYRLTLKKGGDLPGVWVVVDREFHRVDEAQQERPLPSSWGPRPRC